MTTTTFDADGTFTCPHFVTSAAVVAIGPSGTGADGSAGVRGGGGGGGGAYAATPNVTVVAGTAYAVKATAGADASFGATTVVAKKGANASNATGGAGGSGAASTGTTKNSGGTGGNGVTAATAGGGGGGAAGGAAGAGTAGGNAAAGFGGIGGTPSGDSVGYDGGAGGNDDGLGGVTPGTDGTAPGGAPGGGSQGSIAGTQAAGRVTVTYTAATPFNDGHTVTIVSEPFIASDTISAIIAAPATGFKLVIVGWSLEVTGAAAPIGFYNNGSLKVQDRVANGGVWRSAPGTQIPLASATALDLKGGAASGVLNGYISYRTVAA